MPNFATNEHLLKMALAALLIFGTSAQAANLTSSTSQFTEAAKSYKDKKYSQSLSQFKQLHDAGQCNPTIHYYMAMNYQSMSQIACARNEYNIVARSNNSNLKANANYALACMDSWNAHRLYQGNGNNFSRYGRSPARRPPPPRLVADSGGNGGGGC